jgi:hypothetical protein
MSLCDAAAANLGDLNGLSRYHSDVSVLTMYTVARFLQMVGLTIPVLAILAQLNQSISASKMLGFLIASVLVFSIGYMIQRSVSGPQ